MELADKKMISVIIPAYNTEEYIADAIRSVERQTYERWELLVVDDGSTDRTADIVRPFLVNPKIRLIAQENGGVSAARNAGIRAARGEYISFLDSDDFWNESFLEKMLTALQEEKTECFVYSGHDYWEIDGRWKKKRIDYIEGLIGCFSRTKGFSLPMMVSALLVPKYILEERGIEFFPGCTAGEDREFLAKLLSVAAVKAVKEELLHYRRRSGSCTHSEWQLSKVTARLEAHARAVAFIKARYAGDDQAAVFERCDALMVYQKYRYLWDVMKRGHLDLVAQKATLWREELKCVLRLPIYWNNKFQCLLLLSGWQWAWRLFRK